MMCFIDIFIGPSPSTLPDVVSQLFEQYLPRRRSLSDYAVLCVGLHEHCITFHFGSPMNELVTVSFRSL
jgi:hypothetical protein